MEFIKKFSILSVGLSTIPKIFALENNSTIEELVQDPRGIIDLPPGFSYKIISKENDLMDDGLRVPPNADGMTCIKGQGNNVILIRNHEIGHIPKLGIFFKNNPFGNEFKSYIKKNSKNFYDIKNNKTHCFGGTTSIVYNTKTEEVESQYLSLGGTLVNCSGGKTPWNTWISCEEIVMNKGGSVRKKHGYNFEVLPSETPQINKAIPLKEMGRFRHEGIAFDLDKGYVYQTEDRYKGLFYRFIPKKHKDLSSGGKLQALSFVDWRGIDTSNWHKNSIKVGEKYRVKWIDLDNVDSNKDDLRVRGRSKGGAIFSRGEGIFQFENIIYFTATSGGKNRLGQIWKYTDNKFDDNGIIELFYESEDSNVLSMPDNIIIAPNGDILLCEDHRGKDRIVGIKPDRTVYCLANNALNNSEFAGLAFSPDNKLLFVNIYNPTHTLAIKGPWDLL